jgi:hypothetical protein
MKFIKSLFKSLPLAKQLIDIKRDIQVTKNLHEQQLVILQETFKLLLKRDQKYNSSHLIHSEAQIYSQNGEDGIIEEIFERIGVTNKFFIEIGSSNGLENNTALLLLSDWQGIWVEGSQDSCRQAHKHWTEYVEMNFLKIVSERINIANFQSLLIEHGAPAEPDLFSLDIDHNTPHIFKEMTHFKPRVLVLEYNGIFPVTSEWESHYNPDLGWDGTYKFVSSFKPLEITARQKGYQLVHCDSTGTNAFFVREDLVKSSFNGPFTTENKHEPYRRFLVKTIPFSKV